MNTRLGRKLKAARLGLGLTVRDVQRMTGVACGHISRLENGYATSPSPLILRKLSHVLQLDYIYMMRAAGYIKPHDISDSILFSHKGCAL